MSQTIQWSQVKTMVKEYRRNNNALKVPVYNSDTGDYDDMILKGLRVSKSHVMSIFEADERVDELFILFAVRWEDVEKEDDDDQYFTTVLVGLANNQIQTNVAIDFCDPCPTHCPTNNDTALA